MKNTHLFIINHFFGFYSILLYFSLFFLHANLVLGQTTKSQWEYQKCRERYQSQVGDGRDTCNSISLFLKEAECVQRVNQAIVLDIQNSLAAQMLDRRAENEQIIAKWREDLAAYNNQQVGDDRAAWDADKAGVSNEAAENVKNTLDNTQLDVDHFDPAKFKPLYVVANGWNSAANNVILNKIIEKLVIHKMSGSELSRNLKIINSFAEILDGQSNIKTIVGKTNKETGITSWTYITDSGDSVNFIDLNLNMMPILRY